MVHPFQIYRHFKGNLYLIISVALTSSELEPTVVYMSLSGDSQVWTRELSEFESPVPEGKPNPTGQKLRFELVKNMESVLSQCTTENLVEELKNRPDSPFNEQDVEGMNDKVVMKEFVLGNVTSAGVDKGSYLQSIMSADTLEEVRSYAERHFDRLNSRTKIYKSILVEVQSFD